jgi:chromatin remodeling complex protein RSC6
MSSQTSSATNMMSTASKSAPAPASSAKKVAKKEAVAPVAAPVAAAPVVAEAPAKSKKAVKVAAEAPAKAAPVAAPVVVASTPVEQVAPAAPAAALTSLDEDLKTVTSSLTTLRDTAAALLAQVKRLDKRVHREIKDARKRKRRAKVEEGAEGAKPRPLSIFERPVQVTEELCTFLAQPKGTLMSRSQVTKGVNNYVKEKDLKNKHDIKPDAALKKLLALPEGAALTYFNLQRYLNRHYIKAVAPVAAA